jgi:Holliday junction resolvase
MKEVHIISVQKTSPEKFYVKEEEGTTLLTNNIKFAKKFTSKKLAGDKIKEVAKEGILYGIETYFITE